MPHAHASVRAIGISLAAMTVLLTAACGQHSRQSAGAPASMVSAAPSVLPRTGTPSTGSSPVAHPSMGKSGPANEAALHRAADSIEQLGGSFPDTYTGVEVDAAGDRVIVYRKADARFDAALAGLGLGVHVDLQDAPRSRKEMRATHDRLVPLVGHTTGYRIVRVSSGGDELAFTRGVVEVGVNGDLERAKRELGAEFGDRIQVVAVEPPAG